MKIRLQLMNQDETLRAFRVLCRSVICGLLYRLKGKALKGTRYENRWFAIAFLAGGEVLHSDAHQNGLFDRRGDAKQWIMTNQTVLVL